MMLKLEFRRGKYYEEIKKTMRRLPGRRLAIPYNLHTLLHGAYLGRTISSSLLASQTTKVKPERTINGGDYHKR